MQGARGVDPARELESAPNDTARPALDDRWPFLRTFAHEGIRILRGRELFGFDDIDGRARSCARSTLDRVSSRGTAGLVSIKADRHALEARAREPFEGRRANRSPPERDDVPDLSRTEVMYVEQSFDKQDATRSRRLFQNP